MGRQSDRLMDLEGILSPGLLAGAVVVSEQREAHHDRTNWFGCHSAP